MNYSTPSRLPDINIEHKVGGTNPLIPYIISPRGGFLLDEKPTLRWNPVPDVVSYEVEITKGEDVIWKEKVNVSSVNYFGNRSLVPGEVYSLKVEADNNTSSQEESKILFQIASEKEIPRNELNIALKEIDEKLELDPVTKALTKARLFNALTSKDDAILAIEKLLDTDKTSNESQKAVLLLTLGKLYGAVGLNSLAEDYYLKTIALASSVKDLRILADAKAGLAGVKLILVLNKNDEVEQLSSQAQELYKQLGDTESARQLVERLARLGTGSFSLISRSYTTFAWPPCKPWRDCLYD
jgi:hypothetical protein